MIKYQIRPASISLMKKLLEIIYFSQRNSRQLSIAEIAEILKMSLRSVKNGFSMLRILKILKNGKTPLIHQDIFNKLNKDYSIEKVLFSNIKIFPLFNEYLYLLKKEKIDYDAASIIKYIFNITLSVKSIKSIFNGWINYFKIINKKDQKDDQENYFNLFKKEINSVLYIRNTFCDIIGKIPDLVLNDLSEGITQASIDPKNSLTDTGRALENYLRLNYSNITDLKTCNGIGQISNLLRNKKIINPKLNHLLLALGSLRSIGDAHGLDKKENKIWEISEESATIFNFMTIKTIKSLEDYKNGLLSF